ncbi:MAG: hypothetical protein IJ104_00925 [Methanobrevibacter sp.]|nr:hypothetical protein [Methanobrevibacter sp.]MBQ9024933.1 hypothetical protein [Methanobrevibacter sp.]
MRNEEQIKIACGKLIKHLLKKYKKKYDFLAEQNTELHNIQQAIIYEEKSKTITEIYKEIFGE